MKVNEGTVKDILASAGSWSAPEIPEDIPHGDMPGDKVCIKEMHIQKANILFPPLLEKLRRVLEKRPNERAVIAVCGGSGVGKSGVASLLSFYLNQMGIGSYTLSGEQVRR